MFEDLRKHVRQDKIRIIEKDGKMYADYMRLFRAHDRCIECHNPQGIAKPFSAGQIVGVVAIRSSAGEIQKTVLLNRVWIGFGGLIALTGAIIAFYVITQKVILSPIRQLRAMVNNVAEGNLDTRSLIQTRDEYQDLSEAFNNMLDGLQQGQEKLRQANKQLDAKIAELSDRNVELFQANTVKSEFLANISHEFRTPLNAILGFAEIIREKPQMLEEEKVKRYAENIITGGKRLLNMVNDLLDLAKTEAGKMQMRIEEFGLSALCQSVFATFAVLTRDKKIKVRAIVDADIPQLCTDAGKVQQILYNFISNAVNFTPEGGRIEIKASMTDEKHVEISVVDTGCGIAEGDQEAIFEKFRQGDGSLTRKTSGTGLGLAICKELAGMLAGSIGLESEPGVGSRFYIVIPINLTAEQTAEEKGNNE
jgi:signal transduction histidine kinase